MIVLVRASIRFGSQGGEVALGHLGWALAGVQGIT